MGPDGLTAPGVHVGADGLSLASTGAAVIDPGQAAAAAAMLNAAVAGTGVRSLRVNGRGVTLNPGAADSTTIQANDGGLAVTAPRVGPNGTADGASGSATVQLRLPGAGANSTLAALVPRLAFSLVPDVGANGADIAVGAGPGTSAAADAAADAAVAAGGAGAAGGAVVGGRAAGAGVAVQPTAAARGFPRLPGLPFVGRRMLMR